VALPPIVTGTQSAQKGKRFFSTLESLWVLEKVKKTQKDAEKYGL
jgi:hypothetical protein